MISDARTNPALVFVLLFAALFVAHIPLLHLPYFWDEAGYYIPAAHDLFLTGSLIPHSTPSNAHPPLVMAYLALWWKLTAYAPVVTRTAMLLIAAFSLAGLFRLAERIASREVAIAATIATAIYPVFFAQSSLAQVDLAAAGLTFWGLAAYVRDRRIETAVWFSLAALAKETAILAPVALLAWELVCPSINRLPGKEPTCIFPRGWRSGFLLLPAIPLAIWYGYHYLQTGFVFGNPEFFSYNVAGTLNPLRIGLAILLRIWDVFGYLGMYVLTIAAVLAMTRPPISYDGRQRPRIAINVQLALGAVILVYIVFMSVVGGAPLVRYLLPAVPLVIIIFVSTVWRRVRWWWAVMGVVVMAFAIALFVNPPYGFSPEDNLAYSDYIVLHQRAETFLEARYPMARVLTAWPASDELTRPYLEYVSRPLQVVEIENFTVEQLMSAAESGTRFDVALVFSTKDEPVHPLFANWHSWQEWKTRFFGYHHDVPPAAAAQLLGGHLVYSETRNRQWVAIIELDKIFEARLRHQPAGVRFQHQPDRLTSPKMQ